MKDRKQMSLGDVFLSAREQYLRLIETEDRNKDFYDTLNDMKYALEMISFVARRAGDGTAQRIAMDLSGCFEDLSYGVRKGHLPSIQEIHEAFPDMLLDQDFKPTTEWKEQLTVPTEKTGVFQLINLMTERQQYLFACDCCERVLPLYEETFPDDTLPHQVIEAARQYARSNDDDEKLLSFEEPVREAIDQANKEEEELASRVLWAVLWLISKNGIPRDVAETVAVSTSATVGGTHVVIHEWNEDRQHEAEWQRQRVVQYLDGKVD